MPNCRIRRVEPSSSPAAPQSGLRTRGVHGTFLAAVCRDKLMSVCPTPKSFVAERSPAPERRDVPRVACILWLGVALFALLCLRADLAHSAAGAPPLDGSSVTSHLATAQANATSRQGFHAALLAFPQLDALPVPEQRQRLRRLKEAAGATPLGHLTMWRLLPLLDAEAATALQRELGVPQQWWYATPAGAAVASHDGVAWLPEAAAGPAAPRVVAPAGWEPAGNEAPTAAGSVELAALTGLGRPWATLATQLVVDAPEPRPVTVSVGLTGAVTGYLGGARLPKITGLRALHADQVEVTATLPPGRHWLVLRVRPLEDARAAVKVRVQGAVPVPRSSKASPPPTALVVTGQAAWRWHPYARSPGGRIPKEPLVHATVGRALGLPDDRGSTPSSEARPATPLLEDLLLRRASRRSPYRDRVAYLAYVPRDDSRASIVQLWASESPRPKALGTAVAAVALARGRYTMAASSLGAPATDLGRYVMADLDSMDGRSELAWQRWGRVVTRTAPERERRLAGRLALDIGRPDLASTIFAQLHADVPGSAEYALGLAHTLTATRQFRAAADTYRKLHAERPDVTTYALEGARLSLVVGDRQGAIAQVDAAAHSASFRPTELSAAAELYESLGLVDKAQSAYRRGLQLDPASADIRAALERVAPQLQAAIPWTLTLDDARKLAEASPSESAFEVLTDETIVELGLDASATRHVRRFLRVNSVPEQREARTTTIRFEPGHQSVRVLSAAVHRGGVRLPVLAREIEQLSEAWFGLYYDVRRLAIPFEDLRRGDLVEVSWRIEPTRALFRGVFDDLQVLQARVPKHRVRVEVRSPSTLGLRARLHVPKAVAEAGAKISTERRVDQTDAGPSDGQGSMSTVTHVLDASNLPSVAGEIRMPGTAEVAATWQLSTFASWRDVRRWYRDLIDPQRVLTPAMVARLGDVTASSTTSDGTFQSANAERAILDFVTRDIRYVGLEFGIHGYKPYRTDEVWARRFGDCKDQATLASVLLEQVGVVAELVLVRTRKLGRVPDPLPGLALFDHVILYLPGRDLYVDPTASGYGMGELPADDRGAQVLRLSADDAVGAVELGETPPGVASANGIDGDYSVTLRTDGSAGIQGVVKMLGIYAPPLRQTFANPSSRKELLERMLNGRYPGFVMQSHRLSDPTSHDAPLELYFDGVAPRVAGRVGSTLQVAQPGGASGQARRLAPDVRRVHPIWLGPPTELALDFHYHVPVGTRLRELPASRSGESPFGTFAVTWRQESERLAHVRTRLTVGVDQVSEADYAEFAAFIRQFDEAVSQPLVLDVDGG